MPLCLFIFLFIRSSLLTVLLSILLTTTRCAQLLEYSKYYLSMAVASSVRTILVGGVGFSLWCQPVLKSLPCPGISRASKGLAVYTKRRLLLAIDKEVTTDTLSNMVHANKALATCIELALHVVGGSTMISWSWTTNLDYLFDWTYMDNSLPIKCPDLSSKVKSSKCMWQDGMVCMQITSQVIYCTVNASCASKPRLHL